MTKSPIHLNGYYDDNGNWQKTKYCFQACTHCNCRPPGNLWYNKAYDKRLEPEPEHKENLRSQKTLDRGPS